MVPTFGVFIRACLIVGGIVWCREIFSRLGADIGELVQSRDWFRRLTILFMWALTGLVIYLMARFAIGLLVPAVRALRTL